MSVPHLIAALTLAAVSWPAWAVQPRSVAANAFVVASGHPCATAVGVGVLADGGNVVDAAIATSLALGVAEPYGSGLGGKLSMLYRDAASGRVTCITALCKSPRALDDLEFAQLPRNKRRIGYRSVSVPGLIAGLGAAHGRWGSRPWSELVLPAARLAESGVTVNAKMRQMFLPKVAVLRADKQAAALYLVNDEAPPVGAVLRNADQGLILREIAANGPRAFYTGTAARRIVAAASAAGSPLTLDDFRDYEAELTDALAIRYRGHTIFSSAPPLTGGTTVLAALRSLEQIGRLAADERRHSTAVSFADDFCRCLQGVYPRVRDQIGDAPTAQPAAMHLVSESSAAEIARAVLKLDPAPVPAGVDEGPVEAPADSAPSASTSHLVVVDSAGNMVSLTQSLSLHFGAAVVAPGTGILLNDSMSNFATHDRGAVNHVRPAKRARSTIAPILATKAGQPYLALGIPGGQRIPTTTVQLLWRLIDRQTTLQEAFAAPRFHLRRPLQADQPANVIDYETGMPSPWVESLAARGWDLQERPRDGHYFGGGNAALYQADGSIVGVADSRRTNCVAGK